MSTQPSVDLSTCAKEPIHIPGSIQPHGLLLGLDEDADLPVVVCSRNTGQHLGMEPDDLLGKGLADVLDEQSVATVRESLALEDPATANPLRLAPASGDAAFDGILHRTGGLAVLELERARHAETVPFKDFYHLVRRSLNRLQRADTLEELYRQGARAVRAITGFERVMIYRFDEDWNGAVVAEELEEGLYPYLGLHWPSTDIPSQARELYRRNWLRLIANSDYEPVPLVPGENPKTGKPLDLSDSVLRSVSPVHIQYLKNMGVRSSMSISLIQGGQLWGLIACHDHHEPNYVPFVVRQACEYLGQTLSLLISEMKAQQERNVALERDAVRQKLLDDMQRADDFVKPLLEGDPSMMDVIEASGAAVLTNGRLEISGDTPSAAQIHALADWLSTHMQGELFRTNELPSHFEQAEEFKDTACGIVAATLSRTEKEYLLWFRPEKVRTVDWGGDPNKPVEPTPEGQQLNPRESFEKWTQEVRGTSRPFTELDEAAADHLRINVVDMTIHHAARELQRLNRELERKNSELDSFAYIASHDLKEPLRGLFFHARTVIRDFAEELPEEGQRKLDRIMSLSERMSELIDSLLHYSRLGRADLEVGSCDLEQVLAESLDMHKESLEQRDIETSVGELPATQCDPVKMREVFNNFISNAIKYADGDKAEKRLEFGHEHVDGELRYFARDNGIGIPEKDVERVFDIFKRLHGRDEYGGGTGAGLTIVRKIVERHGGRVWAESTKGEGTTFWFTLG
jgi:light-regulated signal transduction histidine kinase (bacteriophytochrome)